MYLDDRLWYAILHADVLTEGVWKAVAELQDPGLKRLAALLPDTVLRSCADSTSKKYINAFQRWRAWAELHDEVRSTGGLLVHVVYKRMLQSDWSYSNLQRI